LRELPCVLAALKGIDPDVVVVDGYVMLTAGKRGLGGHLHEAIRKPIVGVAKNEFRGAMAESVVRGGSKRPLFVTSAGMSAKDAAAAVRSMYGADRIPALLARADALCRGAS